MTWIMHLLPDSFFVWITYVLFGTGLVLYVASKLLLWLPVINAWRWPAELMGVVLLVVGAYLLGGHDTESSWRAKVLELQAQVKLAEEKSIQVNTVIQEKIVTRVRVIKEVEVKIQERILEVAQQIDAVCRVDAAVLLILNQAAQSPVEEHK